ncbi:hypothetical protein OnM2_024076 [Erysiphe neolycopersici]|uniref:Uncharacterized protein n=1 Tax=Erysiphe neolycopersici TaxID=212602 RepID=A0A420I1T8_9PEZI|nr:hypothetical protein OnM2_024076 [Erysiphe neolycopersici]
MLQNRREHSHISQLNDETTNYCLRGGLNDQIPETLLKWDNNRDDHVSDSGEDENNFPETRCNTSSPSRGFSEKCKNSQYRNVEAPEGLRV